jgi:hypothetical protein
MKAIADTNNAVADASAARRTLSPPDHSPRDDPINNEIADVTVIDVCRELQNNQNTNPAKRHEYNPISGGNPANDASPIPAGNRYAASVTPATASASSQPRRYWNNHRLTGSQSLSFHSRSATTGARPSTRF